MNFTDKDILFGRGRNVQFRKANQVQRQLCELESTAYAKAGHAVKKQIVRNIVHTLETKEGIRFYKESQGEWALASQKDILKRIRECIAGLAAADARNGGVVAHAATQNRGQAPPPQASSSHVLPSGNAPGTRIRTAGNQQSPPPVHRHHQVAPSADIILNPSNSEGVTAQLCGPLNVVSPLVHKCVADVVHALKALQIPLLVGEPPEGVARRYPISDTAGPPQQQQLTVLQQHQDSMADMLQELAPSEVDMLLVSALRQSKPTM